MICSNIKLITYYSWIPTIHLKDYLWRIICINLIHNSHECTEIGKMFVFLSYIGSWEISVRLFHSQENPHILSIEVWTSDTGDYDFVDLFGCSCSNYCSLHLWPSKTSILWVRVWLDIGQAQLILCKLQIKYNILHHRNRKHWCSLCTFCKQ